MFHFNLEPLLNQRKSIEKMLKRELAESERSLAVEKSKLDDCQRKQDRLITDMQLRTQQKPLVSEIRLYTLSHDRLASHLMQQKKRVCASETNSRRKRDHLVDAMKNRKVIDRLKEKRFAEYQMEEARQERVFMSDIAIQHFNRKT